MAYSFQKVPPSECEVSVCEIEGSVADAILIEDVDITSLTPYEILDESGDPIATVYSENEAEVIVSHLNR